jgi:hypothetical protein
MFRTGEDTVAAREIGNIRFLIEQQLQIIDVLDRQGHDQGAALDLLKRLMRRDEDLRSRLMAQSPPIRVA